MYIEKLPPIYNSDRDDILYEAICQGHYTANFTYLTSSYKDHIATFYVLEDDLKVDNIRINVSAFLQQKIADKLDCMLLTAKLADLIFAQADIIITPCPRKITSSTDGMIKHSQAIDKKISLVKKPENSADLIATTGKHWLVDNKLQVLNKGTAINYGWHFKGNNFQGIKGDLPVMYKEMPGVRMIQSRGTHHNIHHVDYSQNCRLVSKNCVVNGMKMNLEDLLKDPELAYLANHDGILLKNRILNY